MKRVIPFLLFFLLAKISSGQDARQQVERACLDYLEGFYEGDTTKLIRSLKPSLYKFGYWKSKTSGNYEPDGKMTFHQAIDYARSVYDKKNFPKPGSPKKVEVLDIMNNIAAAKVTAWWGSDYILLAKQNDKWLIEQVLWEGPLENK